MNSIRNRVYAGEIAGGADTVEYVIVAIVAVIIGAALIAFGNQMQQQIVCKEIIILACHFNRIDNSERQITYSTIIRNKRRKKLRQSKAKTI